MWSQGRRCIVGLSTASPRYPVVSIRMATGAAAQTSCTLTIWDGKDEIYVLQLHIGI